MISFTSEHVYMIFFLDCNSWETLGNEQSKDWSAVPIKCSDHLKIVITMYPVHLFFCLN